MGGRFVGCSCRLLSTAWTPRFERRSEGKWDATGSLQFHPLWPHFCILLWGYVGIPLGVPEHRDRNLELTNMRELKLNSAAPDEADEREDNRSPIDQPEQEDDDLLPGPR